ncbi:hypothetical protein ACQKF0_26015 [Bacillus wiedmannii]|uniref:hypothetical protein n=1 Tax=Bacillus wiedmannii TaxID=1890302 RepID=UPI003CFC96EB
MVKLVTDELILIEALREKVNADEYHPNLELKFDVTLNNGKVREVDPHNVQKRR